MKKIYLFLLGALLMAACSETDNSQRHKGSGRTVPITITATKGGGDVTRVAYSESDNVVTATWEASDELIVLIDGVQTELTLSEGAGTSTATFSGELEYDLVKPSAETQLTIYVKNDNIDINDDGSYSYKESVLNSQTGTFESATSLNVYKATPLYGNGTINNLSLNSETSLMKFLITVPTDVDAGTSATLSYVYTETIDEVIVNNTLSASFTTVANPEKSTIWMAVPAGSYTANKIQLAYANTVITNDLADEDAEVTFTGASNYAKVHVFSLKENTLSLTVPNDYSFSFATPQYKGLAVGTGLSKDEVIVAQNKSGGELTVTSSKPNSATAYYADNKIYVTGAAGLTKPDTLTITVKSAATDEYASAQASFPVIVVPVTTLADLKTKLSNGQLTDEERESYYDRYVDANGIIFGGGGVISAGSSSTSTTSWNVTGSEAVGIIAYFGTSAVDESFPDSRFLIMRWNKTRPNPGQWGSVDVLRGLTDQHALNGYANTQTLVGYGATAHPRPYNVWNFELARPEGASRWFMLSAGQWELIYTYNQYYDDYSQKLYGGDSSTECVNENYPGRYNVIADNTWFNNDQHIFNGYNKSSNSYPTAFFVY